LKSGFSNLRQSIFIILTKFVSSTHGVCKSENIQLGSSIALKWQISEVTAKAVSFPLKNILWSVIFSCHKCLFRQHQI